MQTIRQSSIQAERGAQLTADDTLLTLTIIYAVMYTQQRKTVR